MQYVVGLLIFSAIGSFVIADTIVLWRDYRKGNNRRQLLLDFFRIVVIAGMAGIGYLFASSTFQRPNDGIVFLVTGIVGALLIHICSLFF
jgi:hypothetical protein